MRTFLSALGFVLLGSSIAFAGQVGGYYRSNGTYVAPYYRSNRDSSVTNNYSYEGNTNPYTGSTGTNDYNHDLTSPFYNGTPYSDGHYGHSGSRY
ncbi:hypothetical protein PY650_23765 [Rhizobium calliandrae]|uniref:Uncharacterized protein n=1 Tax=Rhizobium calliandrae TaxID=1312182 RepID=A0ABT7KMV7_9HYPH|nr:hypothetical protein [Rhizobium calliandrae]MDL2408608.1 hypothetical protein [Rhizobium calliandrae]